MRHTRLVAFLSAAPVLISCADPIAPRGGIPPERPALDVITTPSLMARFVSLGTSNSQGVQSAGISAAGQRAAWPVQLARRAGVPYEVPAIQDPGCSPPLVPPLAVNLVLVGAFGGDLVSAIMTTCAPLESGDAPGQQPRHLRCQRVGCAEQHHRVRGTIERAKGRAVSACAPAGSDAGDGDGL